MFVSVDFDGTRGLAHKHESAFVVADLMHIELPVGELHNINSSAFLHRATVDEMRHIWKSIKGVYPISQDPETLRGLIRGYAQSMPCNAVDEAHLQSQANCIPFKVQHVYEYVPGKAEPKLLKSYVAPVESDSVTTGEPRQRMSGAKEIIWAKADDMWSAAGKPTDKGVVLKLRKDIMDALEKDGVNRNSASNELGNWQKARI